VHFLAEILYNLPILKSPTSLKSSLNCTKIIVIRQEESRSISENVTWGQRKRFADGKVSLPYGQFLGYEKGEDGIPKIVEKQASVARLIYKLFLEVKHQ
jgi:site-specific DNA recombinase